MKLPTDLKYAKSHEWIKILSDGVYEIGITDFAQKELGDIVFVALPEVGDDIEAGQDFGTVESVKTSSDVYCPVTGTVEEINDILADTPEAINQDPYGTWFIRVRGTLDEKGLLDAKEYDAVTGVK
ncbi:glycine cleavage system protein GcvH [Parasphaerochaeta coccoides]|uniref:Glycine cleavage system H protein n=1 Tax=Parasphaerochaeta coccoides (strain ATCC BAA-1237 / DSM 17374 / SPN1) TaxID=760011 RepID=F4GLN3_PARC1|nr:glycine cleavage system protein GcvH [Parasphaerochaeta coccoides]AEC02427.1 Glycine cleavage system H protein [Parasphaerochaeta coccoides DSM 17374]